MTLKFLLFNKAGVYKGRHALYRETDTNGCVYMSKETRRHLAFPRIVQYRTSVKNMRKGNLEMSRLKDFRGTVKVHGTNAGLCYNKKDGLWCQSRSNIVDIKHDNAGFAFHIEGCKEQILRIFQDLGKYFDIDLTRNTLAVYGEWCGGDIQKNVAICQLPKMFIVFGVKCVPHDLTEEADTADVADTAAADGAEDADTADNVMDRSIWLDYKSCDPSKVQMSYPEHRIYNIYDFPTFSVTIDLDNPKPTQNTISELTLQVEECCPVAKALGVIGIGEGIVWEHTGANGRLLFKTTGEKHSATKVKTICPVDLDKLSSVKEFVECTVTKTRFEQALEHLYRINPALPTYNQPYDIKDVKRVIEWIRDDIFKEDLDLMRESQLTPKDITKEMSTRIVAMYKEVIQVAAVI